MTRLVDDLDLRLAREARDLAAKQRDAASPYCRGDRRRFVQSIAAIGGITAFAGTASAQTPLGATVHDVPPDASKTPGYPLADVTLDVLAALYPDALPPQRRSAENAIPAARAARDEGGP